ncbi:MAG: 2-isopropylmalate synthase [Zoogloeaceae bacterium]|jgi:2-isopropylmalate synthase|nr:2-isopropylmalate synthase [Zoogloeaceae bacterium]
MLFPAARKYRPFPPVVLPDRQWPQRRIEAAPVWMSTDLRDGNQALFEPMDVEKKLRLFQLLCDIGVQEIEVAFPAASQTEFDFVRRLIEEDRIPEEVTIEVLTQAREPLIRRTFEAIRGARRAIVHVYNATSAPFREMVFGMTKAEVTRLATGAVELIRTLADALPETRVTLEYSPETFTATELDFALEVCDAVTEVWDATPRRKVILNLPTTVEMATPNVYADQIEWMHRHLRRRDSIILSLHPHNDRGTAIAAAELGLMAGADRVEGCLFGNGERTGNADLVTLALNLYTQGVDPGLDFSDLPAIARAAEACTQLPIHPRHPYAGDLVFTAFSGSHQDAIRKGLAAQKAWANAAAAEESGLWNVPYLTIDPADIGRNYDALIRVNSQSGKGGIAFLLETEYGLALPRRLLMEFSGIVQKHMDAEGGEVRAEGLWKLFSDTYLAHSASLDYREHHLFEAGERQGIRLVLEIDGVTRTLEGFGNGPLDAAARALEQAGHAVRILSFEERALAASRQAGEARASAFVELALEGRSGGFYGVGLHENIVTASLMALVRGVAEIRNQGSGDRAGAARPS